MKNFAGAQESLIGAQHLLRHPNILKAFASIDESRDEALAELIRICEIPAPPFQEGERAAYLKTRFERIGLERVRIDDEGNVLAERPGTSGKRLVVISAHLDTVFPGDTNVRVRPEGGRLLAPGIGDNTCGVASLPALAAALDSGGIRTADTICLVGTVGEEGPGNLRGVRHLFAERGFRDRVLAFVSIDGPGVERITNRALGSRRYKVTISGPGGHSWGDFGIVNPVHALGRAIARFAGYPAPLAPRTSFSVGLVEGGSSVNAIPQSASMTVDLRSVSGDEIDRLESFLRRVVEIGVRDENLQRSTSGSTLRYDIEQVGNRPSGETPVESRLVRLAINCSRALGIEPRLDCSSTDSNVPISMGLPAITIGAGGLAGSCHTLEEWYDPTGRELGLRRLLLLTAALAGLDS